MIVEVRAHTQSHSSLPPLHPSPPTHTHNHDEREDWLVDLYSRMKTEAYPKWMPMDLVSPLRPHPTAPLPHPLPLPLSLSLSLSLSVSFSLPFSLSFTHSFFFLHTRAALTWARATGAWGGGRQADGGQCWLSARGNEYSARVYSRPGPVYLPASYIKRV